jgi:hypothetical protein
LEFERILAEVVKLASGSRRDMKAIVVRLGLLGKDFRKRSDLT